MSLIPVGSKTSWDWAALSVYAQQLISGAPQTMLSNTTDYAPLSGYVSMYALESNAQNTFAASTFKKLKVSVTANSLNGSTTFTIRKNGVGTTLTLTVTAGSTGVFNVSSDVSVADDDLISLQIVTGGSTGQITFNFTTVLITSV